MHRTSAYTFYEKTSFLNSHLIKYSDSLTKRKQDENLKPGHRKQKSRETSVVTARRIKPFCSDCFHEQHC